MPCKALQVYFSDWQFIQQSEVDLRVGVSVQNLSQFLYSRICQVSALRQHSELSGDDIDFLLLSAVQDLVDKFDQDLKIIIGGSLDHALLVTQ